MIPSLLKMGHSFISAFQTKITILQQLYVKNVHQETVLGFEPMTLSLLP